MLSNRVSVEAIQRLVSSASLELFQYWLRTPCFSTSSFELVKRLDLCGVRPNQVFDVGANIGQFAVAAADRWSNVNVVCFEPNPQAAIQLKWNIRNSPNISMKQLGIGAAPGTLNLRVNAKSFSSSFLPLTDQHRSAFPTAREIERVQVEVSTLDREILEPCDLSTSLLKIDVQGFERNVLEGAERVLRSTRWVVMEVSFESLYEGEWGFDEALRFMDQSNFRLVRPVGVLSEGRHGSILQIDALFEAAR